MIREVWDRPAVVSSFVARGLWGDGRGFGKCKAVGWGTVEDGFIAGVVYHNFDPWAGVIEISAYAKRRDWLNRNRLRAVFSYPFDQLGLRLCVARISEQNTRTLRIWRALGADFYPIPDMRADGEAEIVAVLRRATWQSSKFAR